MRDLINPASETDFSIITGDVNKKKKKMEEI
jgi:hypothetical protein